MKKILPLLLFLSLIHIGANGQSSKRTIQITGSVRDAFTEMYVPDTKVTLMSEDSTVLDSGRVKVNNLNNVSSTTYYQLKMPARIGTYILKFEHPNYKTCVLNYELKRIGRRTGVGGPEAKMQIVRKNGGLHVENELDEVTVKATKVQFYYKGDTIVYNADAFNLPEGSMLDALIKQLPGAELKENGEILINGRKIDYLTLNGKKMFNGNGQFLMQNLPHYSVKDLKVFEKNEENLVGTGKESVFKDYVMDVSLKREYNKHNFGHVELGAGTKDRKIGRLFDTYTQDGYLGMGYVNLNNVNQTRAPGEDGKFSDSDGPRSVVDNKQFGLSSNLEKNRGNFAHIINLVGQIKNTKADLSKLQETHLTQGNVLKNSSEQQNTRISSFDAENALIFRKPFFIYSYTHMVYNDGKDRLGRFENTLGGLTSSTANVNRSDFVNHLRSHSLNLDQSFWLHKPTGWGDEIQLKAGISYQEGRRHSNESQIIIYPRLEVDSLYEYLANENVESKGYKFNADAMYKFNFPSGIGVELQYSYNQENNRRDRMRLRNLEPDNCYYSNTIRRENLPGVVLTYQRKGISISTGIRLKAISDRMGYEREELDTLIRRSYLDFFPDLRIKWSFGKNMINFYTKYNSYEKPSVQDLVEKVDDTNPLFVTMGNGKLKKGKMYDYQLTYRYSGSKHDFTIYATSQSQFAFNSITRGLLYDENTGSYLSTPYNVNGGWHSYNAFRVGQALNSSKSLRIQNSITYDFYKSIGMTGTLKTGLIRNPADRHKVEEALLLTYQRGKLTLRATGEVKYQGSRCNTNEYSNYDAWDIHYGMSLICTLPWNIQLSGDMGVYSRKGYSLDALNKDNLISNASLSRGFLKNKLFVKLSAYDIFHELTSVVNNVYSSYTEEINYNCIPRYGMLSVTYRFGKK